MFCTDILLQNVHSKLKPQLHSQDSGYDSSRFEPDGKIGVHQDASGGKKKIAIRGDGKSPDQKVIDMQLQAANLVYIFDVIILSVTANKSGRLTVLTYYTYIPYIIKISQRILKLLSAQASPYKVHSREITQKTLKESNHSCTQHTVFT